jgi:hypothetical protein
LHRIIKHKKYFKEITMNSHGTSSPDPLKLPPPPFLPETILDLIQLSAVEKFKLKVSNIW